MATAIDPDILIIDEILAVGDLHFQKKCVDRIFNFKKEGKSIVFCSHSLYDVRQVCDEVIWFKDGNIEEQGDPLVVTNNYANYERGLTMNEDIYTGGYPELNGAEQPVIKSFVLVDGKGRVSPPHVKTGDDLRFELEFNVPRAGFPANLGVGIFRTDNILLASFSSLADGLDRISEPGDHKAVLHVPDFRISEGEYNVVGYVFDQNGVHIYDHIATDRRLVVQQEVNRPGMVHLHHRWEW
jgi:hypothetical protein